MKIDKKLTSKASLGHATVKKAVFPFFSQISSKSGNFQISLLAILFVWDLPLLLKKLAQTIKNWPR